MGYVKRGAWSPEEDQNLIDYIMKYGICNWSHMPKFAGLSRTGKSCRLRWVNYLRPDLKRGPFTMEEVETVITMYQSLGNRWSAIAKELPGRTDNEIKNFYHTHLKKRLGTKVEVKPKARSKKAKKSKQMTISSPIYPIQKGSSSCITFDKNYQTSSPLQTSNDHHNYGMTSSVVSQNIVILESNPDTSSSNLHDFMESSNYVDFWLELYMAADNMTI